MCVYVFVYVYVLMCTCGWVGGLLTNSTKHMQVVRLNYTGKLEDGTVFDSTMDAEFLRNKNMNDVSARTHCASVRICAQVLNALACVCVCV